MNGHQAGLADIDASVEAYAHQVLTEAQASAAFVVLVKGTLHWPQVRIDPEQIVLWRSPVDALFPSYGLVWAVTQLAGRRLVQHSGAIPGTLTSVAFLPEDGIVVAVCVASPCFQAHTMLSYHVLEAALGLSPQDWRDRAQGRRRGVEALEQGPRTAPHSRADSGGPRRSP